MRLIKPSSRVAFFVGKMFIFVHTTYECASKTYSIVLLNVNEIPTCDTKGFFISVTFCLPLYHGRIIFRFRFGMWVCYRNSHMAKVVKVTDRYNINYWFYGSRLFWLADYFLL